MRVLFLTSSPGSYMAPPLLGSSQINAGPDWCDETAQDGRVVSLRTPIGEYDLAEVLERIPAGQRPDAVVALVDSSWRNRPLNVRAFAGPKALLVADTHHLKSPLIGMITYMASESFDRFILLYDRHHAGIFHSAGLANLFWLPGLTFPHSDAVVRAARRRQRSPGIAFVGQAGAMHSRRHRLLGALEVAGLPVARHAANQRSALGLYGASLVGFNASLNGDLNLRVLEILASGAALLTDRLAPASGFDHLWRDGEQLTTYGDVDELLESATRLLADPTGTAAMGAAGARWFDQHWSEMRRRELFLEVLLHGRSAPEFELPAPGRAAFFPGDTERLLQATMVYEGLQELHRQQEDVRVALGEGVPSETAALCATLPRIVVGPAAAIASPDMLVFSRSAPDIVAETTADRLWCADALPQDFGVLAEALEPAGYQLVSEVVAVLCREQAPALAAPPESDAPHVLIYTDDPSSGGVAQYNHSLMMGLVAAGFRVSCAQSAVENPLIAAQRAAGVRHYWIAYDTQKEFSRTVTDCADAERILAASRPDLVVFSDCCPVSNMAGRRVAMDRGVPFMAVVGFVGAYLADRFAAFLPELAEQYREARAVVAVSRENLGLLRSRFGLPASSGTVIHYGRPDSYFAAGNEATRVRLRAELNLPAGAVVCLTAARLSAVKGHGCLIDAMRRLSEDPAADSLHLVWAGDGELNSALKRTVAEAGLANRIHFLGHRWDVADWLDAADIFALPSELEGMPLAIMEAMAKGLPVVATAVSGIPEELGDTGCVLPPAAKDREALVHGLTQTLRLWTADAARRRTDGEACRRRASAMFREARMVEETVSLIRSQLAPVEPRLAVITS